MNTVILSIVHALSLHLHTRTDSKNRGEGIKAAVEGRVNCSRWIGSDEPSSTLMASLIAMFASGQPLKSTEFLALLNKNPSLAREVEPATGNLPLHYAAAGAAPAAVISALLEAYPDAAAAADGDGNMPIMAAVANGCDAEAIGALLDAHPDGVSARKGTHTLLHQAACHNQTPEVVELLLAKWPDAAVELDDDSNAPLHFAAACKASAAVVKIMLDARPEVATWRGLQSRVPLSLALLCEAPPASVELLQAANPDTMRDEFIVADYMNHGQGLGPGKMITNGFDDP